MRHAHVDTFVGRGWHNNRSPDQPNGYGIAISAADRDRYFASMDRHVFVTLGDTREIAVTVSPSFWHKDVALHSTLIGRWLLDSGCAPWPTGQPPHFLITRHRRNKFSVVLVAKEEIANLPVPESHRE